MAYPMKDFDTNFLIENVSYEDLAHALYMKGDKDGFQKVTDKTKWREPVMAEKLNHVAHTKISAGAGKDEYGSDAYDQNNSIYAEYKTQAIVESQLKNLFEKDRGNGKKFVPLKITGVYNGAYKESALEAYEKVDHYFGIFYKEVCVMIIKPDTTEVMNQLRKNNDNRKPGATTNLNNVTINLGNKSNYTVAYKNEKWFLENAN